MSEPKLFPCGGVNQPPCPPVPCAVINGVTLYTLEQVQQYGLEAHAKGAASATIPVEGILGGPDREDL